MMPDLCPKLRGAEFTFLHHLPFSVIGFELEVGHEFLVHRDIEKLFQNF